MPTKRQFIKIASSGLIGSCFLQKSDASSETNHKLITRRILGIKHVFLWNIDNFQVYEAIIKDEIFGKLRVIVLIEPGNYPNVMNFVAYDENRIGDLHRIESNLDVKITATVLPYGEIPGDLPYLRVSKEEGGKIEIEGEVKNENSVVLHKSH